MRFHRRAMVVNLVWFASLLGCSSQDEVERVDLYGKVTYQNAPIPKGRIDFLPDRSRGNEGPAGYAVIEQGEFDTGKTGRGAVPGPQSVVIQGFDGLRGVAPGMDNGNPLFDSYETAIEVRPEQRELSLDVPKHSKAAINAKR